MGLRKRVTVSILGILLMGVVGCSSSLQKGSAAAPAGPAGMSEPMPAQKPQPQPAPQSPGPSDPVPPLDQDPRVFYPAPVWDTGSARWGYLGPDGKFAVAPRYERAGEFDRFGLATVERDGHYGLINKDGREVLPPRYDWLDDAAANGVRLAHAGQNTAVINYQGAVLFTSTELAGNFQSGLAPIARKVGDNQLYGYVDLQGQVVIEPQYLQADTFRDGKALVKQGEGTFAILDPSGKRISTLAYDQVQGLSEDTVVYQDKATKKYGYLAVTGEVRIPAQFSNAQQFDHGFAVVTAADNYTGSQVGLINRKGETVIPLKFSSVQRIGPDLYAVGQPQKSYRPEAFVPKALMAPGGPLPAEFPYYSVQSLDNGVVSVSDDQSTFFLNGGGQKAVGLPVLPGVGSLQIVGDLIRAETDEGLRYLTKDGHVVWQEDRTQHLAGGITVRTQKFRTNRYIFTTYPEFAGLPNPKVQAALNKQMQASFVDDAPFHSAPNLTADGQLDVSATTDYSVEQFKNLLVVKREAYVYPIGAAHGMTHRDYYHIDSQTGVQYSLADLFKRGSGYTERLQTLVAQQIAAKQMHLSQKQPVVKPDQPFHIQPDRLVIYYRPYDIGPYAVGFPTFEILYADIMDLIDTQGALWQAFHG